MSEPAFQFKKWGELTEQEKDRAAARLVQVFKMMERHATLSDHELVDRVITEVWGKCPFPLGSEPENLLDELITRFEKRAGIRRDDDGKIVPPTLGPNEPFVGPHE